MIAKHMPMRSSNKSHFYTLIAYLHNPQNKQERVGQVTVTNCLQDKAFDAVLEIQATQALNQRTQDDKSYHLILSFRPGESLPTEVLTALEQQVCTGLGYADHQRISVVHHDTDNLHVHIAINKIHPLRHTIHTPYYPYKKLGALCVKLEQDYGLQIDNHVPRKTRSENRVADMEQHSGVESLLSWIRRECAEAMTKACSWAELHKVMVQHSLELRERGNGLVIIASTGIAVKASSVARSLSKVQLEKRLGVFSACPVSTPAANTATVWRQQVKPVSKVSYQPPPQRQNRWHRLSSLQTISMDKPHYYDRQPLFHRKIDTAALYIQYKEEQQHFSHRRKRMIAQAQATKERLLAVAKQKNQRRRLAITMLSKSGVQKRVLYTLVSQSWHKDVAKIKARYGHDREAAYRGHYRQTWADWLTVKAAAGNSMALMALRARKPRQQPFNNAVGGGPALHTQPIPGLQLDTLTKDGTIIYRVGKTALRDDGDFLNVSRDADECGLEAALRMARYRYGEAITVQGSDMFKARIVQLAATLKLTLTFTDATLERHRQELLTMTTAHSTPIINEEPDHDRRQRSPPFILERRRDSRGSSATATTSTYRHDERTGCPASAYKSNLGRARGQPPPDYFHRVRNLSQLGMVQRAHGSQVLLPGDVSGHLEHQGTDGDHRLRRDIYRSRTVVSTSATMPTINSGVKKTGKSR